MKLSYGITVHNEADELNKLLEILVNNIDEEDEIIICDDYSDRKTKDVIEHWDLHSSDTKSIKTYQRKLDGNFSDQKNSVIEQSSGDYIFHIDADEYPHDTLLAQLKQILEINDVALLWIPRVNTIEGMKQEHINKWGWRISEQGWVNYPDYQWRVWKNKPQIKWKNKVHEVLNGHKTFSALPSIEGLALYHPKTIDRQEKQNAYYNTL